MPTLPSSPPANPPGPAAIAGAYDDTNSVYRLLSLSGWGPALLNLGYYRRIPFVGGIAAAQRRLVRKAVALLDVHAVQHVLDVACGRGESSSIIRDMHPDATVEGIDLLPGNIAVAEAMFQPREGVSYRVGNAMSLELGAESVDHVLCIEAAFHFPDRAQFIAEAYRVLRPGGRLVIVDFTWRDEVARLHRDDPETRIVRDIWRWDDFFTTDDYHHAARDAGFRIAGASDWSDHVTHALQIRFALASAVGNRAAGRALLRVLYPAYNVLSIDDWRVLAIAVHAHAHVQRHSQYMAFAFDKP